MSCHLGHEELKVKVFCHETREKALIAKRHPSSRIASY